MRASDSLHLSIPAPPEAHDSILRARVAPLARALEGIRPLESFHFERANKPDWRLLLSISGDRSWLEEEVPRILEETFRSGDLGSLPFEVVEEPSTDKWTGGPRESALLAAVYFADTVSCLDWLTAEETFALSRSRPEMSLLLVERMLDRLGLDPRSREAFYRRGYQWAIDSGRWGPAVLESLEEKYRAQRASLLAMLDPERPPDPEALWGGREESRLAVSWIDRLGPPLAALAAAPPAGRIPVEVADFVAHAHSNRLGIHATQEAVIRHLVERARTELGAGAR